MLSCYVLSEHKTWDRVLSYLTFAYNTAAQFITKRSPFPLLYGQEPVSTTDTFFSNSDVSDNFTLADATCRFAKCRQIARTRIADTQASAKLRYDDQNGHVKYSDGALVWLWVPILKPGGAEKHKWQYVGPYRMLYRLTPVTYEVAPVNPPADHRCRSTKSAHASSLKPYVASSITT